ncbi:hypothetical protein CTAYLR_003481 [Chrysophaeum taylorii]|uniref:GB1/RHD3-type G domain-containing protein n=1 Tax=Chrysophaeum taylorii TaxID=2483200 RepID=A0AAD7XJ04_9STRA|nr:hypothetical protein CTAYLR_003481 [Chrysophaeum taylorii]
MSLFGFGRQREKEEEAAPATTTTTSGVEEGPFRKAAVPLVEVDDESKFSVNPEARSILESLKGKICVVSVAGLYRTGKSSLVNFILEHSEGFTVGPTVRRCTRGIWFWGEPRRATLPSGEPCWVVVLDTEGLGGLEADQHYDTRIFSLATLLCSTLVYNSLGSIDESAISNLSFVANLSQHIRISGDSDGELEAHDFHKFFPSFVWVVRDFALDLVDEYNSPISSDEYLERSLKPQVGFDAATTERNRVRSMMTAFFTERKCFPLVRPLLDEERLQQIDKVGFDNLRSEFKEGVEALKSHLYETHLKPKEIHGRPLNGSSFVALVEQYIQAIEGGSVPTIATAWEEVMTKECADAKTQALAAYDQEQQETATTTSQGVVASTDKLFRSHLVGLKRAIATFKARAGGEHASQYQEDLEDELTGKLSGLLEKNEAASKRLCEEQVVKLHDQMVRAKDPEDLAALKFDVQTVASKYAAVAAGPAKDSVLAEYALGTALDAAQSVFEKVEDAHEQKVAALEAQVSEAAGERAKIAAREKVVADALEAQQRELISVSSAKMQLEAQAKATETRLTSLFSELQRANRRKEELEQDLEDTKDALESEQTWQAQLHARLEDMENKSTHKESKLDELGRLLEEHKKEGSEKAQQLEAHREKEKDLTQTIASWETKHSDMVVLHDKAREDIDRVAKERDELYETHAADVAERAKLIEKRDELAKDLEETRAKIADLETQLASTRSEAGESAKELEAQVASVRSELRAEQEAKTVVETKVENLQKELQESATALEEKQNALDKLRAELDGANATHAELLRAHSQLANDHRSYQHKMNQRVTYLKSQLDEHQSTSSSTSTELQRKAVREVELEKRLEVEINLRASLQSEKDAQLFDLQKKLAEATTRLRQTEAKSQQLKTSLESAQAELNQIAAQRAVLLDEKDKMQNLWEKSLTDHFNSLHETQSELAETKAKTKDSAAENTQKMKDMQLKLDEYRAIVEKIQTKKEGLLRKRTRSRLVKQTWHVKLFKLVGTSLLHRDTDNAATGEKTFKIDATATVDLVQDSRVKNSFKVTADNDELVMAAIDKTDMQEWVDAINDVISEAKTADAKTAETKQRFASMEEASSDPGGLGDDDYSASF